MICCLLPGLVVSLAVWIVHCLWREDWIIQSHNVLWSDFQCPPDPCNMPGPLYERKVTQWRHQDLAENLCLILLKLSSFSIQLPYQPQIPLEPLCLRGQPALSQANGVFSNWLMGGKKSPFGVLNTRPKAVFENTCVCSGDHDEAGAQSCNRHRKPSVMAKHYLIKWFPCKGKLNIASLWRTCK